MTTDGAGSTTDPRVQQGLDAALALGEVGVQVAAYVDGELVVDAWTGLADRDAGVPVEASTLFSVFSVSKQYTLTALHLQAERGLIDYDAPVADYWPSFAQEGKDAVTVRQIMMHRSGFIAMPRHETFAELADWDRVIRDIEVLPLHFAPGTTNAYQAMNHGWIVGELVRRTDAQQRPFAQFVRDEVFEPLGMDDFWFGIEPGDEARVATLVSDFKATVGGLYADAMPPLLQSRPDIYNRPEVRRSCWPSSGGITTARSGARLWGMLADRGAFGDVRLLSEARVDGLLEERAPDADPVDPIVGFAYRMGLGGFRLPTERERTLLGDSSRILFGSGAGGSIGWADLDLRMGVLIAHNRMFAAQLDLSPEQHPFHALSEAVRAVARDHLQPVSRDPLRAATSSRAG